MIVFRTEYVVFKDEIGKCNDLFVRGYPGTTENAQSTDTHWRCRTVGSFNWRMKFPVFFPMRGEQDYGTDRFTIQLFDRDLIGSDTFIGDTMLDLNTHRMIAKYLLQDIYP